MFCTMFPGFIQAGMPCGKPGGTAWPGGGAAAPVALLTGAAAGDDEWVACGGACDVA